MTDVFLRIAERLGIPTAILFVLAVATIAFIRGPLVRFVDLVRPRRVLTLHGFAVDFAGTAGWGIGRVASTNPSGIGVGSVNAASSAIESIRYSDDPAIWQGAAGAGGQVTPVSVGSRTIVASGIHCPFVPSAETARNRNCPNVDAPKLFSGSNDAITVWLSCRTSEPAAIERVVFSGGSAAADASPESLLIISIVSLRGNFSFDLRKKIN